ncbi:MAG: HupE/UreJ family protein [Enterobacteriaceae bacterium]
MRRILILVGSLLLSSQALAHTGLHIENSFISGLLHPLSGLDHLLVMLAAGLWISSLATGLCWKMGALFVAGMVGAAYCASALGALPGVELAIALSVTAMGFLLLTRLKLQSALMGFLLMTFGAFHGYAHGLEAPLTGFSYYIAGFSLMSLTLILVGIAIGRVLQPLRLNQMIMRAIGAVLVLLSGSWIFT